MEQIPDAPWIREAERDGYPAAEPVWCPVCEECCETIFKSRDGTVIGCDSCVVEQDAWEWLEEKRQAERDYFLEHNRAD